MPVTVGDKIAITDTAADPLNNGELTNNGGVVKVKANGVVLPIGFTAQSNVTIAGLTDTAEHFMLMGA